MFHKHYFKTLMHITVLVLFSTTIIPAQRIANAQTVGYEEIENAVVIAYMEANPGINPNLIFVSDIQENSPWAYGIVGIRAESEHDEPELIIFIGQFENTQWNIALQGSSTFFDWIWNIPDSLISSEGKASLAAPEMSTNEILEAPGILAQGNGANLLNLPWSTGETWNLTGGPHSNSGNANEMWSALDFSNATGKKVRSTRDGVVWMSTSCPNFVLITHPDGYKTGYYHLTNIAVTNGQGVARGAILGDISSQAGCGGSATGAHVHFSLRNAANSKVAINGIDIGGWTVLNGSSQYTGCMQRVSDGVKVCATGGIYNDGTIGSGTGTGAPPSGDVVVVNPPALAPAYSNGMCGSAWYRFTGYNGAYAYLTLNTNQSSSSKNSAIWQPNLPKAGTYKVEAYIATHNPINWECPSLYISWDTSDARYTVYHANGSSPVSGNQAPLENQWLNLGNFTFNAGTAGRVKLVDLNGEASLSKTVSFSAVRFTLVSAADTAAPKVTDISLAGSYLPTAQSVAFDVVFTENVTGVDLSDFQLGTQKVDGASLKSISGSGSRYIVTLDTGRLNTSLDYGSIRLSLLDNDSIRDSSNNPLGGTGSGNGNFTSGAFVKSPQPPPVILVHGYQGTHIKGYSCQNEKNQLNIVRYIDSSQTPSTLGGQDALADWFKGRGYDVWIAHLDTSAKFTPALEANALCLAKQIEKVYGENSQPVTIVAHSMGGLVSRAAIRITDKNIRIEALYTLGTPHAGLPSQVVPLLLSGVGPVGPVLAPLSCAWQQAACQMSTTYMPIFNHLYPNKSETSYIFIGGGGGIGFIDFMLRATDQGPNDNLVGQYSAVGWKFDEQKTNPVNWTSQSIPKRYFTDETHPNGQDKKAYYLAQDGQGYSDSFGCIMAIMKNTTIYPKYCYEAGGPQGSASDMQEAPQVQLSENSSFTETRTGHLDANQLVDIALAIDTNNSVIFQITWNGGVTPLVTLTSPSSQMIDPVYAANHPLEVTYESVEGSPETPPYVAYRLNGAATGEWKINITNTDAIDYRAFAIIDGPRTFEAYTDQDSYQIGDTASITATLRNVDTGISGAIVTAKFAFQDETENTITMNDPESDGTYTALYPMLDVPGFVYIDINASGNDDGLSFTRQTTLITSIAPNDVALANSYTIQAKDDNFDNLFEQLDFNVTVDAETAGRYVIAAELYSDSEFITQTSSFYDLIVGTQNITLQFNGSEIRKSGLAGPYTVTNLSLTPVELGITAISATNLITTSAYDEQEFGSCLTLEITHSGNGADPVPTPSSSVGCAVGGYIEGEQIQLSGAVPSTGWSVVNWSGTENDASIQQTNTVTVPLENHALEVVYGEDTSTPAVEAISRSGDSPSSSSSVGFSLIFSENVTGVDATDFAVVTSGGIKQASISSVSGSGDSYLVLIDIRDTEGNGTLKLELVDNDSIMDGSLVPLGGPGSHNGNFVTGEEYSILDVSPPSVLSISRVGPVVTSTSIVTFTVVFSESVVNVNKEDFVLATSGVMEASIIEVSGADNLYIVTVSTGRGNGAIRLDIVDNNTIIDMASNPLGGVIPGDGDFRVGETYTIIKDPIFSDVSSDYWAGSYIERLYNAGITGGCGVNPLQYCPETTVTRSQMAVFLLRGIHGSSYSPPAMGSNTGFGDVPIDYWSAVWIKQLAAEGITGGCGSGNYCPEYPVTRDQMAVFLLRSKYGSSYSPPAVGISTGFGDVPVDHWAAPWIKQLVREGITAGCGNGNYCPDLPVTRAQMAVFLVRTFNLP